MAEDDGDGLDVGGSMRHLTREGFERLLALLEERGYDAIGPDRP